jgi:hypothetical protein
MSSGEKQTTNPRLAKRRLTPSEKFAMESETLAREKPRNLKHTVIMSVQDETDENGEPIIVVLRMNAADRPNKQDR